MKKSKKLRLLILVLVGGIQFSCTKDRLVNIHNDMKLDDPCVFEKFTALEIAELSEQAGSRIARNQENCRIIRNGNIEYMQAHNQEHSKER